MRSESRFKFFIGLILFVATVGHASSLTNIHTVFLIVMENVSWSDLAGSTNAPYINNVPPAAVLLCQQHVHYPWNIWKPAAISLVGVRNKLGRDQR